MRDGSGVDMKDGKLVRVGSGVEMKDGKLVTVGLAEGEVVGGTEIIGCRILPCIVVESL
jgi:hypothetical protein